MRQIDTPSADLVIDGDGRELYRAKLTSKTFRLATLDLRGIRQVTFRFNESDVPDGCGGAYVRVAQMLCYSNGCDRPGPSLPAGAAVTKSRILTDDPIDGDIAALPSLVPERHKAVVSKRANLRWLMSREKARQTGYSPFEVSRNGQLMMPPAEDHSAWLDVDVADINGLVLSPRINPLNAECKAMNTPGKEAGVVGLQLSLDGKVIVPRKIIDRDDDDVSLPVDVSDGRTLRIEVDKGNDVSWCDWFSVGVTKLDGPAVTNALPAGKKP